MDMLRILSSGLFVVLALATAGHFGHPEAVTSKMEQQQSNEFDSFVQAANPREAEDAFLATVGRIDDSQLRALKFHEHPGVALRSAWEEVRRSVAVNTQPGRIKVSSDKLNQFVGFVEGRIGLPAPDWWQKAVLGAEAYGGKSIHYPLAANSPYHGVGLELIGPRGTSVRYTMGKLRLEVDGQSVELPASVYDEMEKEFRRGISAAMDSKRCYLAAHDQFTASLFCIDRESAKVMWKANVRAAGEPDSFGGVQIHFVTVVAHDDVVAVFGAAGGGIYIEGFRRHDGSNLFRFSSMAY